MPMIDAGGFEINVKIEGPENAPVLMLSNSIAADLSMWDPQAPEFAKRFRLIRYDRRGHGASGRRVHGRPNTPPLLRRPEPLTYGPEAAGGYERYGP